MSYKMGLVTRKNLRPIARQGIQGQTTLEFSLAIVLFIFILLLLVQFGIVVYAQNIVTEAAQEGARVAASADKGINDGIAVSGRNLEMGLGDIYKSVKGSADQQKVTVEVSAQLPCFLPFLSKTIKIDLRAKADMLKEGWRS